MVRPGEHVSVGGRRCRPGHDPPRSGTVHFGRESNRLSKSVSPSKPRQTQIRSAVTRDPNAIETRLDIAFHIPSMKGNDVNRLDLAADILGARDDSRLVRILKSEKALVNSISAESLTPKEPGLMMISASSGLKKPGSGHQGSYGRIGSAR